MSFGTAYATKKRMGKGAKMCAEGGDMGEQSDWEKSEFGDKNAGSSENDKKMGKFAKGGEIEEGMHGEQSEAEMLDMVGRIMKKHYSKGGEVANDVGVSDADKLPAEYDELVLDDDLEGEQPGDSNEHGDMVEKILSKRKK